MKTAADLSDDRKYRFSLWRSWAKNYPPYPKTLFVMLNPSTADAYEDDPTIRRCIGFTRRFGGESLEVVNLFALRATNPKELRLSTDAVGSSNDFFIERAAKTAGMIIAAWGAHRNLEGRDEKVLRLLTVHQDVWCLGTTKHGYPRHPLYCHSESAIEMFRKKRTPASPPRQAERVGVQQMKKPKLSEIRARDQSAPGGARFYVPYLLDLVERMGKMIDNLNFRHHSDHYGLFENCDYPKCRRVRALLEELGK